MLASTNRCRYTKLANLIIAWLSISSSVLAAESPAFRLSIDDSVTIDTVTSAELGGARAHINFPYLKQQADGDLVVNYTIGQTQSGLQTGGQMISSDGGLSWSALPSTSGGNGAHFSLIRPAGQFSRAFGTYAQNPAGFNSWGNSRYNSSDGGNTWDSGFETANYSTGPASYTFMYSNFGDVIDTGGSQYMALYGTRLGSTTSESVLFISNDDGKNWSRRSTIASYTSSTDLGQMGSEGPSETALMGLDNGGLLAVFRTGQTFPNTSITAITPSLFWSISHDNGFSWSPAKSLGVAGVFPVMRKLDDGSVALTFGRYGAKAMFADPTGTRWTTPAVIYDGPGSGHTEMRRRADGRYVYVYDQSGFYPPSYNANPPSGYVYNADQSANLVAAVLDIQPLPQSSEVLWSIEYHGDVSPDASGLGWTATLSGTGSTRLLAEQGQDYLRYSTGNSGSANVFNYSMNAEPGSAWAEIDFARGLILEIRARVAATSTAEGSASILLGDGIHGSMMLEFDGNSVNLDGLGGSPAQVEYSSTNDPSFSPRAWHDYRILVSPDNGGVIRGQVFLDGDFGSPILSQQLAPSSTDEIRFGDLVPTQNGIFEIDYLRFAPLPVAVRPGDYNDDGQVDAADFVVWRKTLGTAVILPQDATPGYVTPEDYDVWTANFSSSATGSAANAFVPELSSLTHAAIYFCAAFFARRRTV